MLVGILDDFAGWPTHVADGNGQPELATPRFTPSTLIEPLFEHMKLGFRHRALQAEQKPVVVVRRIVYAVEIRDQRSKDRTHLEQLIPVPARSREPRHVDPQDQSDVIESDLGDQALKPRTSFGSSARTPQIVVDDHDPITWPAKRHRSLS